MFPFDALFVYFSILEFVPYKSTQYMQRLIIILALLLVESQATFLVFYFFFSPTLCYPDHKPAIPGTHPCPFWGCLAVFAILRAGMSDLGLPEDRKGSCSPELGLVALT